MTKSGVEAQRVVVAEILSSTTFRARVLPNSQGPLVGSGYSGNQGGSDLSAFNTNAVLMFEEQVVKTQPDYTRSPHA